MKKISIIIAVYNEEKFIDGLLKSIEEVDYPTDFYEIVVVSDGSTDQTVEVVKKHCGVRLIELPENMGRYYSRKTGVEAARYPNVLFIDARTAVYPNILSVLDKLDAKAVNGYVLGASPPGVFETFYTSIRRVVFRQYYLSYNQPVYLTLDNFDSLPKGTGVLFVEKEVLFQAYEELSHLEMGKDSSDDTKLVRTIVSLVPVLIHPEVKITYFSRPSFRKSVKHLYERGPKFVDYYFDPALKKFWLLIVVPLFFLLAGIVGMVFLPLPFLLKLMSLVGVDFIIALILARSLREFLIISFMLPICFLVFYLGIIRGILQKSFSALQGKLTNPGR